MPVYTYEVLGDDGRVVETYEAEQPLGAPPLGNHPVTGEPLRRVLTAPRLNTKYADWDGKLEAGRLSRAGFTRYEKDRTTGRYYKSNRGAGPEELDPGKA
jgi:hypothetical protein